MTSPKTKYTIRPRDYNRTCDVLNHDIVTMLEHHPEAFDCIVYPALESEQNEIEAVNKPNVTLLDRDERKQTYGEGLVARAMSIPDEAVAMGLVDSGLYEHFESVTATGAINLVLSVKAVRSFSLIQWMEYADHDDVVERTVYVADIKQCGHSMGVAGCIYVCYPLTSVGDLPDQNIADIVEDMPLPPHIELSVGVI